MGCHVILIVLIRGSKLERQADKMRENFCYDRLALTSIFGLSFMLVCLTKSNCYSLIYSSLRRQVKGDMLAERQRTKENLMIFFIFAKSMRDHRSQNCSFRHSFYLRPKMQCLTLKQVSSCLQSTTRFKIQYENVQIKLEATEYLVLRS